MKHLLFICASLFSATAAMAQETYENANLATEDLNGTARYVGMGGAMEALGADISVIGTNPAGIGLFRHSTAHVSFGVVSQQDGKSFANGNKTNMSFDQAGFVYSKKSGRNSFVNLAFNYHKSRNFDYILSASDRLRNASQNKLSYAKGLEGVFNLNIDRNGYVMSEDNTYSNTDYLNYNALMSSFNANNEAVYNYYNADNYMLNRANTGYIGEYDFNISGNVNDRVYWGLTVGISDVHYKAYGEYQEALVNAADQAIGDVLTCDERKITGTGFNVKAGVIFRPLEESPFRIGFSVATPTWYDLTTSSYTTLNNNSAAGDMDRIGVDHSYDFKLYTPWKFGASLGTTLGDYLAIGASYEYADYSSTDTRIITGSSYDWYFDEYRDNTSSDNAMNRHTENTLKGVSTVKVGMEMRPDSKMAFRVGYNYVSPMYEEQGYKDVTINSPGTYIGTTTDYTNWKATNRITCGFGYNIDRLSIDLAYQYSVQSGNFKPFMDYYASAADGPELDNISNAVKVDNKRHQVLLTLGYHF